jgi:hypothetical protein
LSKEQLIKNLREINNSAQRRKTLREKMMKNQTANQCESLKFKNIQLIDESQRLDEEKFKLKQMLLNPNKLN